VPVSKTRDASSEGGVAMLAALFVATAWMTIMAHAHLVAGDAAVGRVRPRDEFGQFLVDQGRARSPTFARLLSALETSDVVVYVDLISEVALGPSGRLQFVGAGGGRRYLLASVEAGTTSWGLMLARHQELIAILGHELQHALEVAAAPAVADGNGFAGLYHTIGIRLTGDSFDTHAARVVGEQILSELRDGRPSGNSTNAPP
jgi:hypothetical protein